MRFSSIRRRNLTDAVPRNAEGTREFDLETLIDKKAKDFTKLLSEAVKQVPPNIPSVIHIISYMA